MASAWQRPIATEAERERLARRRASAATALLLLEQSEAAWQLFQHHADPTARNYLVHRAGPQGVSARLLVERL
jgi:hypothetical protein